MSIFIASLWALVQWALVQIMMSRGAPVTPEDVADIANRVGKQVKEQMLDVRDEDPNEVAPRRDRR